MSSRQQDLGTGRPVADALPFRAEAWTPPRPAAVVPLRLSEGLLVAALARLAAADSRADVASAALPLLLDEPGVRACAVLQRDGDRLVVLGSAGYDCDTMAPGAALPLDAGLPVTEAVRTGRLVERGTGPAWVAVPFPGPRTSGALLLSLTAAPPGTPRELAALRALTSALADALRRAQAQERTFLSLALVTASLAPPRGVPGGDVAVRSLPLDGVVGGDVVLVLPDGSGGTWLLVADACRSGLEAAVTARTLQAAVTALATRIADPGALLGAVEGVLASADGGGAVTACAVRVSDRRVEVVSAGHAVPVLLTDRGAQRLDVPVGPALGSGAALPPVTVVEVPDGAVLALHTDGLTVRGRPACAWPTCCPGAWGTTSRRSPTASCRRPTRAGWPRTTPRCCWCGCPAGRRELRRRSVRRTSSHRGAAGRAAPPARPGRTRHRAARRPVASPTRSTRTARPCAGARAAG